MIAVSPLAPTSFPNLPEIEGVRFAAGPAGIRDGDRTDVMLAVFGKGTQAAGFLRNRNVRRQRSIGAAQGSRTGRQLRQRQCRQGLGRPPAQCKRLLPLWPKSNHGAAMFR
jgi:hypothetical protein